MTLWLENNPDRQVNKMYFQAMEYYSILERNAVLTQAKTWMSHESIMLSGKKNQKIPHI